MMCIARRDEGGKQHVSSVSTCVESLTDARRTVQSRIASRAAAWCADNNMPRNSPSKRDCGRLTDNCGSPQGRIRVERDGCAVELGRFLDQTDDVVQSKKLFDLLSAFASNFGCRWMAYGAVTSDRKPLNPVRCNSEEILNYPDDWQERCLERGYERIAPVIKESRMGAGPIRWSDVYSDASTTEYERRIFDEAATFGLKSGVSVPLLGPQGSCAIMSFARHCDREFQDRTITYLQLAATHFHLSVAKLASSNVVRKIPTLSSREKECILWVAKGKSSWNIGKIICISENTVNFHIKNVMRKLDTSSRTVAAIRAISLGIINL